MTSHPARRPRAGRLLVPAAVLAAGLLLVPAGAASAHVRVIPETTASGGFAKLTFRVPNESDTAGTTKVEVALPEDKPFAFVSAQAVPGWTAVVTKGKLATPVDLEGSTITEAARTVTWTANAGTQIGPGQFQEFAISGGPLPAAGELVLPATQTYSDGKVVKWDQPTPEGGEEPEFPAPAFEVTAAEGDGGDAHGAAPAAAPETEPAAATTDEGDGAGFWPWLSGAALVLSIIALGAALLGRREPAAKP